MPCNSHANSPRTEREHTSRKVDLIVRRNMAYDRKAMGIISSRPHCNSPTGPRAFAQTTIAVAPAGPWPFLLAVLIWDFHMQPKIRYETRKLYSQDKFGNLMYPSELLFTWFKANHMPWMLISIEPI